MAAEPAKAAESLPPDVAYPLCEQIRRSPIYTVAGLWCWGCMTFTGGDPAKRCGAVVACPQVLARYRKQRAV